VTNSFHSERLGGTLHLGKADARLIRVGVPYLVIRKALVAANALPELPQKPWGHGHDLPQGKWKMLGNGLEIPDNDEGAIPESWTAFKSAGGCGNCTIVDCCHTVMEACRNAGVAIPMFTIESAVKTYMARTLAANGTAYSPETGEGDTGLDIQAVVEWLIEDGIEDANGVVHKILPDPITLEPGNVQHLREATWLYEKVKIGLVLTEAQETQFDASPQPTWDYVKGSPEIGGHDTPVWGEVGLGSWAEDVYWTPAFIENQCDEAIAVLHPEQFEKDGEDYEGYTEGDIEKLSVELAKAKLAVG
jgi:hypothetical protein